MKIRTLLGEYLIKAGIITETQLEKALNEQKSMSTKKPLGKLLVENGYVTEEEIAKAIADQTGVPYISMDDFEVDESAMYLLDSNKVEQYNALPIGFENDKLITVMSRPKDVMIIDDLRLLTGFDIKPVIVTDSVLEYMINRYLNDDIDVEQTDDSKTERAEEEQGLITTGDSLQEKPAVMLANTIFHRAVRGGASDIHLEPLENGFRVRFRIDGVLHQVMNPPKSMHPPLVSRIKVMANMDIAMKRVPQDGRITLKVQDKTVDVRVASLPTPYGEKLTLRILDREAHLFTLADLGLPDKESEQLNTLIDVPYGFILVTGPTGSGKSTTLYAILNYLNTVDKHIITLEDPVERRINGINQVQVHSQAGMTFSSGLRSILRNDPDIAMVGEIRDYETARIAIETSLTGHLVFSTLHTNNAAGALSRLTDMGIEPYLTTSSLVFVLAQRLVRNLCNNCKKQYQMSKEELLESIPNFPISEDESECITLYKPGSCAKCGETGYTGRTGIYELLPVTESIAQMVLERRSTREIDNAAKEEGMKSLRKSGLEKVKSGLTSLEEVLRVAK
ncbi:GspE/PulE family protein [Natranaerobius trueperi]|uniref:Type II secretion system protein GspE n=1 Tax=Natranaerobius trueperi TaxID=759412 RepID=A0A226C2K6_9FIRM|nr:ATPase, T2SS/T4P/T4SS family [Natranaerobius trueperi]OWZ84637.1 type II secretion system protein GspE [Natranaerobius trueperi]